MARWPLRHALAELERRAKRRALEDWHAAFLRWSSVAPHSKHAGKPPEVPEILKD